MPEPKPELPIRVVVQGAADAAAVPGLERLEGRIDARFATDAQALRAALPGASVLLGWDFRAGDLEQAWDRAGDLRWIHWAGAGVDALLFPALVDSDTVVTNARGVFDEPMAEYVLGLILAMAKGFPETFAAQQQRRWAYRTSERVSGRRALVVGAGSIGRAIARRLRACGLEVEGVGRRRRKGDPDFGHVHPIESLDARLAEADFVVLIAPLTDATRGLFDAGRFGAMKPGARLVNVGRGALLDEAALAAVLESGRLAGAALDVFETEPLPSQSPLWSLPGLIVSPHMSGDVEDFERTLGAQFVSNFERFVAGEPLDNVVDKRLGFVARR